MTNFIMSLRKSFGSKLDLSNSETKVGCERQKIMCHNDDKRILMVIFKKEVRGDLSTTRDSVRERLLLANPGQQLLD